MSSPDILVADVGGILGLFLGFSFMSIWDLAEQVLEYFRVKVPSGVLEVKIDGVFVKIGVAFSVV